MEHKRNWYVVLIILAASWLLFGQSVQGDETVSQMLEAWNKRRSAIRTIKYTLSGSNERTPASLAPPRSGEPGFSSSKLRKTPMQATILLDLEKKRFRIDHKSSIVSLIINDYKEEFVIHTWNGKEFRSAMPRELNADNHGGPDVRIITGPAKFSYVDSRFLPIFDAHGLVTTVNTPLLLHALPPKYDAESFQSVGKVAFQGNNCLLIRTEPMSSTPALTNELWIDPRADFAILRRANRVSTRIASYTDTKYQQTAHGWLPKQWVTTSMSRGPVGAISQVTVTSTEIDIPITEEDFTIPLRPGMAVERCTYPETGQGLDSSTPAVETGVVGTDGSLTRIDSRGFSTIEGKQLPLETSWTGLQIFYIICSCIAVVGIIIFFWKVKKSF